jgi:hypothetical protein
MPDFEVMSWQPYLLLHYATYYSQCNQLIFQRYKKINQTVEYNSLYLYDKIASKE